MPVYGFACDCGQRSMAEFGMDDPEKRLRCPNCGAWMFRDYGSVRIGGDMPSRYPGGYKRDAYATGDFGKEDRLFDEVTYIDKHTRGAPVGEVRAGNAAINAMGKAFRDEQRREDTEERWSKLKIDLPKGFDIPSGD